MTAVFSKEAVLSFYTRINNVVPAGTRSPARIK